MKVKDYKELQVWQKGIEIVDVIYALTEPLPKDELYGLTGQMRRAAISIPANIAEGFVRHHTKEYRQFLYIALGSCAELDSYLVVARRRTYVTVECFESAVEMLNHEMRMIASLIGKL